LALRLIDEFRETSMIFADSLEFRVTVTDSHGPIDWLDMTQPDRALRLVMVKEWYHPLVNIQKAIENGQYIVVFPTKNMDFP